MKEVASRAGLQFTKGWPRDRFRELGLGTLKFFAHCREPEQLTLLQRAVSVHFWNVMTEHGQDAEMFVFDYSTSTRSGGSNQRGTFVCFRTAGVDLPDLEVIPRLWREAPEWLASLAEVPPTRSTFTVGDERFDAEYRAESADEARARKVLAGDLASFLS